MNADELEMESNITDGQIHNEEDDKNKKITSLQETENVKNSREDLEAQRELRTVHDQETVIEPREGDNATDIIRTKYVDHSKVNNPGLDNGTKEKNDKENDDKKTEDGDKMKIESDGADVWKKSKEQTDEEALESQNHWGDEENDGDTDLCEGGSLRRFGESIDLTKSQDGIDEDYTYQPGLHSSLHKWSDMSNLQEGLGSGLNDYKQQDFESISPIDPTDTFNEFQSSGGIFSPTMAHYRDLTLDQGSSVDFPEHSPEATRQSNYPDMFYPDNANNIRNQQILETIPENDSDEPDEQNKGKEEEKVILLKKGNIKKLLQHLLETNVLTEGEFKRCEIKQKREDMCAEMMRIVQRKTGGELLLKKALKEIKVEDESPKKVKVSSKLVEKEREISRLKAKISTLQKELATKSDEIKDLKKEKPINVVEPLIKTKDLNMINTITERRRASRELEAQPSLSEGGGEATRQLQQELEYLKHELMKKDKEMEAVQNIKDTYPYVTDVLGCPSFPIKLPGSDSTVPMYCPVMKFSLTNANPNACQIYDEFVLINEPSPNSTSGYRKYQGTSGSTPFLLPVVVSKILPHPVHYWEAHTVVSLECMILSFHTLFEIGVCEESFVDRMSWLHKSPRSWSIRIGICRKHHWGVCAQVYGSAAKHGLCFTHVMSNIPEKTSTLCYGVVLDVGTGKVGLIDIGKERLLHTFSVEFRENLYPMFGVQPLADVCSINMALMSGDQVEMTERKERLIIKALSSKQ